MLQKAQKSKAKLRLSVTGVSGGGKTLSSLLLASGMTTWDKIALIDTENGSGHLYSDRGGYNVYTIKPPFAPEKFIKAIKECEEAGMEVIIVDSASHLWEGEGGIIDIHSNMPGNSFTNWAKVTPRYNAFIQALMQSSSHIITTTRRKQDYELSKNENGKIAPVKVGMKEIQRDTYEYEFTIVFSVDSAHMATASKDRTGLFDGAPEFLITADTGKILKDWCDMGVDLHAEAVTKLQKNYKELAKKQKWTEETEKENWKKMLKDKELSAFSVEELNQLSALLSQKTN